MTGKEYLQFLAMMIPTFLLLGALVLSLAFPGGTAGAPLETPAQSVPARAEMAVDPAEDPSPTWLELAYAR
jgi:hypothetical protein